MPEKALDDSIVAFASGPVVRDSTGSDGASVEGWPVLATRDTPPEWLLPVARKLERLLSLKDNWDSYGARAVDPDAVDTARDLVQYLSRTVGVDEPSVTATPDGEVGFCWDAEDWSLDASIDRHATITYVFLHEQDPSQNREQRTRSFPELAALATHW